MTVDVNYGDNGPIFPERGPAPANGFHNYPTHLDRIASEIVLKRYRWPLIEKFLRANRINRVVIDTPARKLGIISTGKAVQDVQQAFKLLGLNDDRSEEHTSELQSLMRISYAVFCLKKKKQINHNNKERTRAQRSKV